MRPFNFRIKRMVIAEQVFSVNIGAETEEDAVDILRNIIWSADDLSDDLYEKEYENKLSIAYNIFNIHNIVREAEPHEVGMKEVRRLFTDDDVEIKL